MIPGIRHRALEVYYYYFIIIITASWPGRGAALWWLRGGQHSGLGVQHHGCVQQLGLTISSCCIKTK